MITLNYIGCHYVERPSFIIDRPLGSNDYLFLLFHSPVSLLEKNTLRQYPPGAIILYTPECPQYYYNPLTGIDNDWFHFDGPQCADLINALGLPVNTPFYINDLVTVHRGILSIENEHLMKDFAAQRMIDGMINQLLILVSRQYNHGLNQTHLHPNTSDTTVRFREVRSKILSQMAHPWTLDSMAALANLSRSRFCTLYKEIFTISPKEDLRRERFNMAKYMLQSNQEPISEIAAKVGYTDIYQFSKYFRKLHHMTPTNFRLQSNRNERASI